MCYFTFPAFTQYAPWCLLVAFILESARSITCAYGIPNTTHNNFSPRIIYSLYNFFGAG